MNSLAKTLLHSSRAAAAVGPKICSPRDEKTFDDAPVERQFRADDGQIDLFADRQVEEAVDIAGVDGDGAGESGNTGVPRRAQHGRHRGVAAERPDESVLTAAAADDEDFHERGAWG